jgi:tetratricopeptide (TPR) repeat protein
MSSQTDIQNLPAPSRVRVLGNSRDSTPDPAASPKVNARAEALLKDSLAKHPEDQRLIYFLCLSLHQSNKKEDARRLLQRLSTDTNRSEWTARASVILALLLAKENCWSTVGEILARFDHEPPSPLPYVESSKRNVLELLSLHSNNFEMFVLQVRELLRAEHYDDAFSAIKSALTVSENSESPASSPLLWRLVFHYVNQQDFEAAATMLCAGFNRSPAWRTSVLSDKKLAHSVALICLIGGERSAATRIWEDLQLSDHSNVETAHALFVSGFAETSHYKQSGNEMALAAWKRVVRNGVLLIEDECFWRDFLQQRSEVYNYDSVPLNSDELCDFLELMLGKWLPLDSPQGLALIWEIVSARWLKRLGGLPSGTHSYVCGIHMLRQLGFTEALGNFLSHLSRDVSRSPETIKIAKSQVRNAEGSTVFYTRPTSDELRRQARLFSRFGVAQALLEQSFPERALSCMDAVSCDQCVSHGSKENGVSDDWWPRVCQEQCGEFKSENPGHVGLDGGSKRLWLDATELALEAHIALANQCLATRPPQVETGVAHWSVALRLADAIGQRSEIEGAIEDHVYGLTEALLEGDNHDATIALLEGIYHVSRPAAKEVFGISLARNLNIRGVARAEREEPDWAGAVSDFQRSWELNPHLAIRLMNLIHASRGLAIEVNKTDSRKAAQILLSIRKHLLDGLNRFTREPELPVLMERLKSDLAQLSSNLKEESIFKKADGDYQGELEDLRLAAELVSSDEANAALRIKILPQAEVATEPFPETCELRIKVLDDTSTAWTSPVAGQVKVLEPSTSGEEQ